MTRVWLVVLVGWVAMVPACGGSEEGDPPDPVVLEADCEVLCWFTTECMQTSDLVEQCIAGCVEDNRDNASCAGAIHGFASCAENESCDDLIEGRACFDALVGLGRDCDGAI